MKRIKIMLLSFALLAVVGGALAFKANRGILAFCYTTTTQTILPTCSLVTANANATGVVIYTTPSVVIDEVGQCAFKAPNSQTPLTCTTSIKVNIN